MSALPSTMETNASRTNATSEPVLKVTGLNAFYGRAHILFDVGFEVGRGEVVDLPAPLRPISATTSPRPTSRFTSKRICARP